MQKKIIVSFKSTKENWEKEKSGKKKNTIRYIDWDERFGILADNKATHIEIVNKTTKEKFTRKISDITYFDNLVIISWR